MLIKRIIITIALAIGGLTTVTVAPSPVTAVVTPAADAGYDGGSTYDRGYLVRTYRAWDRGSGCYRTVYVWSNGTQSYGSCHH